MIPFNFTDENANIVFSQPDKHNAYHYLLSFSENILQPWCQQEMIFAFSVYMASGFVFIHQGQFAHHGCILHALPIIHLILQNTVV